MIDTPLQKVAENMFLSSKLVFLDTSSICSTKYKWLPEKVPCITQKMGSSWRHCWQWTFGAGLPSFSWFKIEPWGHQSVRVMCLCQKSWKDQREKGHVFCSLSFLPLDTKKKPIHRQYFVQISTWKLDHWNPQPSRKSQSPKVVCSWFCLAKLQYFTNLDFPEIRGIPFLNHHLGAQVVWGRYNLTRFCLISIGVKHGVTTPPILLRGVGEHPLVSWVPTIGWKINRHFPPQAPHPRHYIWSCRQWQTGNENFLLLGNGPIARLYTPKKSTGWRFCWFLNGKGRQLYNSEDG